MARLLPSSCNINANVVSRVSFQTINKFKLANLRAITKRLLGIILPQDSDRGGTVQKVLKVTSNRILVINVIFQVPKASMEFPAF